MEVDMSDEHEGPAERLAREKRRAYDALVAIDRSGEPVSTERRRAARARYEAACAREERYWARIGEP
jgi:hypothetical protein